MKTINKLNCTPLLILLACGISHLGCTVEAQLSPVSPPQSKALVEYSSTTAFPNNTVSVTVKLLDLTGTEFWFAATPVVNLSVFNPQRWVVPQSGTWVRMLCGASVKVTFADVDGWHDVWAVTQPNGWATVNYHVHPAQRGQVPFLITVPTFIASVWNNPSIWMSCNAQSVEGLTGTGYIKQSVPPLPAVTLMSPVNYRSNVRTDVTLKWNPVPTAANYEIVLLRDDRLGRTVTVPASCNGVWTANPPLRSQRTYTWKIRALGVAGAGDFSDTRAFRTQ